MLHLFSISIIYIEQVNVSVVGTYSSSLNHFIFATFLVIEGYSRSFAILKDLNSLLTAPFVEEIQITL